MQKFFGKSATAVYLVHDPHQSQPRFNSLSDTSLNQGLQLTQATLSHEKYLDEARERVKELEAQVESLQRQRESQAQTKT